MARLFLTIALTTLALGAASPLFAETTDAPATDKGDTTTMPEKIRAKLTADGYKDITVLPTSYAVSATDKDGKPVLLLIGPHASTVLEGVEEPSTAESPPAPAQQKQIQQ
jgi:hypothetical protein